MRIEPTITIKVTGRTGAPDQLRDIQKGAELPARIIERISGREAVIEIAGRRIHAEFQKGVPAGTMITLKLDDIKNNSFFFKLVDPGGKEAFARHLMEMTIFNMNQIQKNILHNISGALAKHPAGILELNALLLGHHPKQDKKDEGLTRFLSFLLKLGIDKNAVSDLSILLSGIRINAKAFQSLLLIMGFDKERIRKWTSGNSRDFEGIIDAIISEMANLEGSEQKETALRQLIGFFQDAVEMPAGYTSGELPCCGEDELTPIQYLGKDDAWVFSVDFSNIGPIEVLAKESPEGGYLLSIFCETNETLEALKKSAEKLQKNLKNINAGIHVNFYNTRLAINKIVEIYSYYSLNSVFDIRV